MRKIRGKFFENNRSKKLVIFALTVLAGVKIDAQPCDPPLTPVLFGQSVTSIYCKNNSVGFGVNESDPAQEYYFSVYDNAALVSTQGGPLDGNGGTLSVSAFMKSAQDAGEYRITTVNECGLSASTNFYAFYGNIDNLSITAWGSNAVSFRWAASGPSPAVTYEYAVTTQPDPDQASADYVTTTDTTVSKTDLTDGATYYIHVRVSSVTWNGSEVTTGPFSDCGSGTGLPWQTIRFVACSGVASVGAITPANAIVCIGSTVTLTETGGSTCKWYREDNSQIAGENSFSYLASFPGEYKAYITTAAGCEGMVSTASVTQTSLQTGIFSGGGCYNLGDSVRLGISKTIAGQTYKILKDGAEVFTLQGIGKAEFGSEDTVWYKFKLISATQYGHYTVRANNPYCTPIDFGDQEVSGYGTWTGTLSQDWQNPANWSCNGVPDANVDVIIPVGAINMPLVNGNVTCRSVTVQPGATLTIGTGFKLNITGN